MNPLDVMTKEEARERIQNPIGYKLKSIIGFYESRDEILPGEEGIMNKLTSTKAFINQTFNEVFDDEPTDDDMKKYEKEKCKNANK